MKKLEFGNPSLIPDKEINVAASERVASATLGGILLAISSKRGGLLKAFAGGYLLFRGITGYCPAYEKLQEKGLVIKPRNISIHSQVTIMKPRQEVYEFWRKLENLPRFMTHLKSVEQLDANTSLWKAKIPGDIASLGWKSEIVEDQPNEKIAWRSLPGSTVTNAGSVSFEEAGSAGCVVDTTISYQPPVGKAGEQVARLLSPVFEMVLRQDIRNLKHFMEKGKLPEINDENPTA